MQEQLLARRALHFTQNEIFFECRELQASEAFPAGLPSIFRGTRTSVSIKLDFARLQMKPPENMNKALAVWWYLAPLTLNAV
jgi:hypothetical protein